MTNSVTSLKIAAKKNTGQVESFIVASNASSSAVAPPEIFDSTLPTVKREDPKNCYPYIPANESLRLNPPEPGSSGCNGKLLQPPPHPARSIDKAAGKHARAITDRDFLWRASLREGGFELHFLLGS